MPPFLPEPVHGCCQLIIPSYRSLTDTQLTDTQSEQKAAGFAGIC